MRRCFVHPTLFVKPLIARDWETETRVALSMRNYMYVGTETIFPMWFKRELTNSKETFDTYKACKDLNLDSKSFLF